MKTLIILGLLASIQIASAQRQWHRQWVPQDNGTLTAAQIAQATPAPHRPTAAEIQYQAAVERQRQDYQRQVAAAELFKRQRPAMERAAQQEAARNDAILVRENEKAQIESEKTLANLNRVGLTNGARLTFGNTPACPTYYCPDADIVIRITIISTHWW